MVVAIHAEAIEITGKQYNSNIIIIDNLINFVKL
jgi:hypothetical protein